MQPMFGSRRKTNSSSQTQSLSEGTDALLNRECQSPLLKTIEKLDMDRLVQDQMLRNVMDTVRFLYELVVHIVYRRLGLKQYKLRR